MLWKTDGKQELLDFHHNHHHHHQPNQHQFAVYSMEERRQTNTPQQNIDTESIVHSKHRQSHAVTAKFCSYSTSIRLIK